MLRYNAALRKERETCIALWTNWSVCNDGARAKQCHLLSTLVSVGGTKLTKTEAREHRTHLLRLEQMGIPIGYAEDPSPEPDRFTLEQIEHEFARIYELPSGAVAVVAPAKLTVRISGLLFTDHELRLPWDDFPLELSDPEENSYYQELINLVASLLPAHNTQPFANTRSPSTSTPSAGGDRRGGLDLCSPGMPRRVACHGGTVTQRRAAQRILLRVRSPGGPQREAEVRTTTARTS